VKITKSQLKQIIKEELEEGIGDYIRKLTSPRSRVNPGDGMSIPGGAPKTTSLERASFHLAKLVVDYINSRGGFAEPPTTGVMADMYAAGWMDLGTKQVMEYLEDVLEKIDPLSHLPSDLKKMMKPVLESWAKQGIITREKPDAALGNMGPWLKYHGFEELERVIKKGRKAGY
jgi:hypothetical protein